MADQEALFGKPVPVDGGGDDTLDLETFGDLDIGDDFDFSQHDQLASAYENELQSRGGRHLKAESEVALMQDSDGLALAQFAEQERLQQQVIVDGFRDDDDDDDGVSFLISETVANVLDAQPVNADTLLSDNSHQQDNDLLSGFSLFNIGSSFGGSGWGVSDDGAADNFLLTPDQLLASSDTVSSGSASSQQPNGTAGLGLQTASTTNNGLWGSLPAAPAVMELPPPSIQTAVTSMPPLPQLPVMPPSSQAPLVQQQQPALQLLQRQVDQQPVPKRTIESQRQQKQQPPPSKQPQPQKQQQKQPQRHTGPTQHQQHQAQAPPTTGPAGAHLLRQLHAAAAKPHPAAQPAATDSNARLAAQKAAAAAAAQAHMVNPRQAPQGRVAAPVVAQPERAGYISPEQLQFEVLRLEQYLDPIDAFKTQVHRERGIHMMQVARLVIAMSAIDTRDGKKIKVVDPAQRKQLAELRQQMHAVHAKARALDSKFQSADADQDNARKMFYSQVLGSLPLAMQPSLVTARIHVLQKKLDALNAGTRQLSMIVNRLAARHKELKDDEAADEAERDNVHNQYLAQRQQLSLYLDLRKPILAEARHARALLEKYQKQLQHSASAARHQKYCNLMTFKERQFLLTVQMKQTQGDDPYLDDYYALHFAHRRAVDAAARGGPPPPAPPAPTDSTLSSFPLLNKGATYKPPVDRTGALGSIHGVSNRAPRAMFSAATASATFGSAQLSESALRRTTLMAIEKAYRPVLDVEDLDRRAQSVGDEAEQRRLFESRTRMLDQALEHIGVVANDGDSDEVAMQRDIAFAQILCVGKGKRLLARALRLALPRQASLVFHAVLRTLPLLTAAGAELNYPPDHIDQLMHDVLPSLQHAIQSLDMTAVISAANTVAASVAGEPNMDLAFVDKFGGALLYTLVTIADRLLSSGNQPAEAAGTWVQAVNSLSASLVDTLAYAATHASASCPPLWALASTLATHGGPAAQGVLLPPLLPHMPPPSERSPAMQHFASLAQHSNA